MSSIYGEAKPIYHRLRQSLFTRLPLEILTMILKDPHQIKILSELFNDFNKKYYSNPNSDFWYLLIITHYKVKPHDPEIYIHYMHQYGRLYGAENFWHPDKLRPRRITDNYRLLEYSVETITVYLSYEMTTKAIVALSSFYDKYRHNSKWLIYINKILCESARYGNKIIFSRCRQYGANDFQRANDIAIAHNQNDMVKILEKYL